jgi:hypothetical protein
VIDRDKYTPPPAMQSHEFRNDRPDHADVSAHVTIPKSITTSRGFIARDDFLVSTHAVI